VTYLDAVLYTGGVIWCGFMGILLLATIINAANGAAEQTQVAARHLAITVTVSIVICVCAAFVWLDGSP
jgi:hypothetical protein